MNQQPPYGHPQPYPQNLAKSEQYHSYSRSMLTLLNIGCIASLAMLIVPYILIAAINDTTSGHSFLVQSDWLGSLGGIGVIVLLVEVVCVMIFDWRGAVTLRGMVKAQVIHKGKLVSTSPSYVLLYLFFPEIMLPIYLVRTTRDHHQARQRRPLELQHQIAALEAQRSEERRVGKECRSRWSP